MSGERLSKEIKNKIIEDLGDYADSVDHYEYGLPIWDEDKMAKMREIIDEAIESFDK